MENLLVSCYFQPRFPAQGRVSNFTPNGVARYRVDCRQFVSPFSFVPILGFLYFPPPLHFHSVGLSGQFFKAVPMPLYLFFFVLHLVRTLTCSIELIIQKHILRSISSTCNLDLEPLLCKGDGPIILKSM